MAGMPSHTTKGTPTPVRPFRLFDVKLLPPKLRQNFKLTYQRIYNLMSEATGLNFRTTDMNLEYIEKTYDIAYKHLKTRVSYIFQNEKYKPNDWGLGQWTKMTSYSSIMKLGNIKDGAKLPRQTRGYNKKRTNKGRNEKPTPSLPEIRRNEER
mmetsp:Transcript_12435/g.19149  ORF Transcript_12435/g.19149 Transcript_12435/m.19149 type:complete len:153 (+) Transcript_12435:2073-2531(+)